MRSVPLSHPDEEFTYRELNLVWAQFIAIYQRLRKERFSSGENLT